MKKILFLLLLISGYANAQTWQPTSVRQRFVNGIGIPTRDTITGTLADSSQVVLRPQDSTIYYKYKGNWRKVGSGSITSLPWDSITGKPVNFTTTYALSNDVRDSIKARVPYIGATNNVQLGTHQLYTDAITFKTTALTAADSIARMKWDTTYRTAKLGLGGGNVQLQIGQEEVVLVHNGTGATLTDGQVVYITGSTGELPSVALASDTSEAKSSVTLGVVTEHILNGENGFVTISGMVHGLNTNSLTEGKAIWLGTTPGTFTDVKPQAPQNAVLIGYVVKKAGGNGSIFVKIQNGYELDELHNVKITQPVRNQSILIYDSTSKLWVDTLLSAVAPTTDTTSLSNRINQRVKYTDTAAMLAPYAKKTYVDSSISANKAASYNYIVYVNSNDPNTATIFDTLNPPVTNNNFLKADVSNLYIGSNASTWVYKTSSLNYITYSVPATSTFYLAGGTTDAGNNKTGSIYRTGNIGIVQTNPIYNLDVTGKGRFTDSLIVGSVRKSGGTASQYLMANGSVSTGLDTTSLSNRINQKLNISDTAAMLTPYKTSYPRQAISLTTTGTSGAATYDNTTGAFNIPQYQSVLTNPVTGTGTANQITYWNGTNSVTGNADFTINTSNNTISIGGVSVGRGNGNNYLNTILGYAAFNSNGSTTKNTVIGFGSMFFHNSGDNNTAVGYQAAFNDRGNVYNTSFGSETLYSSQYSSYNTAIGGLSLYNSLSGNNNTALGYNSGSNISYGAQNVFLGSSTSLASGSDNNSIVIGYNAVGLGTNRNVIGNTSSVQTHLYGRLTLGSTTDDGVNQLQVTGSGKITGSTYLATASGSVGIGTASPNGKVQISGTATAIDSWGQLSVTTTDAVSADKGGQLMLGGIYTGSISTLFGGLAAKKSNATDGNYDGYLQFITSTNGVGNTEKMRITSGGNAIIGSPFTDDGVNKLQVNGSAKITSLAGTGERLVSADANGKLQVSTTAATVTSGTYVPTATFPTNATSIGCYTSPYTRIGNVVTMNVSGYFTSTTANTYTKFNLDVPVAAISVGSAIVSGTGNISNSGATQLGAARVTATTGATLGFLIESYPATGGVVQYFSASIQYTLQ